MKRVHLIRPSFFIFLIVPLGLWLIVLIFGLPHVIWSYAWLDQGQGYSPYAYRYYTRCTYIGPYGAVTQRHPKGGKCQWFVMWKGQQS